MASFLDTAHAMNSTRHLLATVALMLAAPLAALAQPDDNGPPPDREGHRRGPPPEAIAACRGKAIGTQASFTDREGRTLTGACVQMDDVVAIAPPHRPGERGAPASAPRQ